MVVAFVRTSTTDLSLLVLVCFVIRHFLAVVASVGSFAAFEKCISPGVFAGAEMPVYEEPPRF